MIGAEHYREAERILYAPSTYENAEKATVRLAAAQVHATLALAATAAGDDPGWPQAMDQTPQSLRHVQEQRPPASSPGDFRYTSLRKERAEQLRRQALDPHT
jgi:hypothetical protein